MEDNKEDKEKKEEKSEDKVEKSRPVREEEGGKGQNKRKSANERMKKLFMKNVACAAMNTRDKMDAKTAWKIDTDNGLRVARKDQLPSAKSLVDDAALQRRAKRFGKDSNNT